MKISSSPVDRCIAGAPRRWHVPGKSVMIVLLAATVRGLDP